MRGSNRSSKSVNLSVLLLYHGAVINTRGDLYQSTYSFFTNVSVRFNLNIYVMMGSTEIPECLDSLDFLDCPGLPLILV